jgi:hypothetical protein
MFDAYEPYTSESPIAIFTASDTGARTLKMDSTYSQNLLAKASVASVSTLATSIDTRLAGPLAPSKISIVGDDWSQIKIQSNSEAWEIPSEIAFNRESKSQWLKSAMGVAGDLTRGAFWWVGGEDRININCETGVVSLKNGLKTTIVKTDIIQSLTSTTVRIDDRLVVGGSVSFENYLGVNGSFAAFGDSAFSGDVSIVGILRPQGLLMVDSIRARTADFLSLEDNVVLTGTLYKYQPTPTLLSTSIVLVMADILRGIIVMSNTGTATLYLPYGTDTYTGFLGPVDPGGTVIPFNTSFDWTVIASSTASSTVRYNPGHSVIGSATIPANTSGTFRTRLVDAVTAITYRL